MVDGRWGAAKIEQASLDCRVGDFLLPSAIVSWAQGARRLWGVRVRASSQVSKADQISSTSVLNVEVANMATFDLAWIRLSWSRVNEVIRDPMTQPVSKVGAS